ncbi:hypothetical protein PTTG_01445 [Puccinia triticina 1-1 BBBD Race 1]|uniref:Uncharacterized protein n=1 Tax=Puccinia triticina (isolate 1-1 / race 1 (BBBD)) TaxID=630390 RepID=A0A180H5U5_PUCT1|nr:hypothetical protein PTTG_01445 [Puccinia triticina 1-1 BBBD Race 1]
MTNPPDPAESRPTRNIPSETATTSRSRFGFPAPPSSHPIPHGTAENTLQSTQPQLRKSTRISSSSTSQIARPGSALARPATALGTHSAAASNSRLPQSSSIPAPSRKRRTSSVSSQRPAPFGHIPASNPTRAADPSTELQKQLADALDRLNGTQQECSQWKSRAEEAELRVEQSLKDQHEERVSFCQEIKQLEDKHEETIQQIKQDSAAKLARSQDELERLAASNAKSRDELDKSTAHIDRLQSEIEQMDIDSGRSAAQVIELTRLKTELESKLHAAQSDLKQAENRLDQVTQHYHNIQSKLHQDLDQMTADYQASLQQQALFSSSDVLTQFKTKIHQLEQKIKSQELELSKAKNELDRLVGVTAQHHEEKREWDVVRDQLEHQLQELDRQISAKSHPANTTAVKAETESSIYENQLIDLTMMVGDSKCDILPPRSDEQSAHKTDHSLLGGLARDSSALGLTFLDDENDRQADAALDREAAGSPGSEATMVNAVPREEHDRVLLDLKTAEAELEQLKAELAAVNETISTLRQGVSTAERDHAASQTAAQAEFEAIRTGLEDQLTRAQQAIEGTVPRETHDRSLADLRTLEAELADLKAQLLSSQASAHQSLTDLAASQHTIEALEASLSTLKQESAGQIERLALSHAAEIAASAEKIKCLQTDLDQVNSLHAQSLSKLDELAAFNPEQIAILTARLREERDSSRRAIEFMHVERQALEATSRDIIERLRGDQSQVLRETTVERNSLVVTILTLQGALKAWKKMASIAQIQEAGQVHGSPSKVDGAVMDISFAATSNISLASHLRGDLGFDSPAGPDTPGAATDPAASTGPSPDCGREEDHAAEGLVDLQAYEAALDQISQLSKQVDELKEQLLQTYVAHQEHEKLALLDVESVRAELAAAEAQHVQTHDHQARTIISLELQFEGIQHQFHSLERSYTSLRGEKEDLTNVLAQEVEASARIGEDRERLRARIAAMDEEMHAHKVLLTELEQKLVRAEADLAASSETRTEALASVDCLRVQVASMDEEIRGYKAQIADLREKLSHAEGELGATSETHTSMLAATDSLRAQVASMDEEMCAYKQQIKDLEAKHSAAINEFDGADERRAEAIATVECLRAQIGSMDDEVRGYKQQIADLEAKHSLAHEDLAATSEKQTSQLTIQVEQLTHDLRLQEKLAADLQEQFEAAVLVQKEHMATVEKLEETLQTQKGDRETELESRDAALVAQQASLEKQLSDLQLSLEEKTALNVQLQERVGVLDAQIQEEQDAHRALQAESLAKLSEAIELRAATEEQHRLLQSQVDELVEKIEALEAEKGSLTNQLESATEEQQATAADLTRTQEELAHVTSSRDSMARQLDQMNDDVRLLTEELQQLKTDQSLDKQSSEKYETLLGEFKALEEQLPTLSSELEIVRSELDSASGMVDDMAREVAEKEAMISQLKADLATVSKLHRRTSSAAPDPSDRIPELEARIQAKTLEAEDAVDKLLEELQKNKRLAHLVETLKIKLKSKANKAGVPPAEPRLAEGSEGSDPGRVSGRAAGTEEAVGVPSSSRKRKHDSGGPDAAASLRVRGQLDEASEGKENADGSQGRQPVRRKTSASAADDGPPASAVLRPVSVNQPGPFVLVPPTTSALDAAKPAALKAANLPPAAPATNSSLLASIRRKQQRKQLAISALNPRAPSPSTTAAGVGPGKTLDEPRRTSLRLVRKEQENL